ncbi:chloride channel protein [Cyanobium sp. NIES-981]|uniref:chloride channel protein n=1 Tax=Cyanobium sp. NIES-981 TaxID=1851505 RepID=UPI0007DE30A5|nr:chloride channel protein [Cyanobium sp. NIES-981]SBO41951.1 Chloride channel [Cyanobium sp. NIES-981]
MPRSPLHRGDLRSLGRLLGLGVVVGLACWPLNLVDDAQSFLQTRLPSFTGEAWTLWTVGIAAAPLLVMPILLALQAGPLGLGAGSGIPQTLRNLEGLDQDSALLGAAPTTARLGLWTAASLALMPLGREGPVVHLGAAIAQALQRLFPRLLAGLRREHLVAIGAGAGLAGGFNSPLMGTLFVMEELTGSYSSTLLWPSLVACSAAALISNLDGVPLFPLGLVATGEPEWQQLLLSLPVGVGAGLLGGLFARILLVSSRWLKPRVMQQPWRWGLALGAGLALFALLSGGWSGGDGETLMEQLLEGRGPLPVAGAPLGLVGWALVLASRVLAPVLALAAGVPGGLIDPAFTIGAVFGSGVLATFGGNVQLGVALGMAGGLAGATQLPLMTVLFSMRLAGDQQWLFGILMSAVIGAYAGRRLQPERIYHALSDVHHDNQPA